MRSVLRLLASSVVFGMLSSAAICGAQTSAPAPAPAAPVKDDQAKARAKVHFERGITAYKEGRYKDAIDAFLDAHRQYPSPTLSFNTARAYEKMGDSAGALRFYREYLRQSPDAADRSTVEASISELETKLRQRGLMQVTILSVPEGATVILDERPVGVTPWTGEIFPGTHRARLRREGYADKTEEFELSAHRSLDVSIQLAKASEQPAAEAPVARVDPTSEPGADAPSGKSIGIATWATLGAGVAALGGALVFEILRGQSEEDVKSEETQLARHEAFDTMESRQTTSRVLAGIGGAALIVGGVLLYLDLSRDSSPEQAKLGLGCGGSGCAASLRGSF